MSWYGKITYLIYGEIIIASYKIYCEHGNTCEVELNLYHPFNKHRAILSDINVDDVDNVVLDYMDLQSHRDT